MTDVIGKVLGGLVTTKHKIKIRKGKLGIRGKNGK